VNTALDWKALDGEGFERLLFAVISDARGYENLDRGARVRIS
jgi:hypothetical protein